MRRTIDVLHALLVVTVFAALILIAAGRAVSQPPWFRLTRPAGGGDPGLAPHVFPPFTHWDLREFPDCEVPWMVAGPVPDLDGNGLPNEVTDLGIALATFQSAFQEWEDVWCSELGFVFGGLGVVPPGGFVTDGWNTLSFSAVALAASVQAATLVCRSAATGRIVEADIVFNSAVGPIPLGGPPPFVQVGSRQWVTYAHGTVLNADFDFLPFGNWPNAADGDTDSDGDGIQDNEVDLGTIAMHEIGHFLGLAHFVPLATAHNNNNNALMEQNWIYGIGPNNGGWTNIQLKAADEDGENYLYCPDLGDAPDPWMDIDGLYPTKVHEPGTGRTLNGLVLDGILLGAQHIFGIKPTQDRNWTYEWLACDTTDNVNGECYPNLVDNDLFDDGLTFFPYPPIWLRDLCVTAWIRYASDNAGNSHNYAVNPLWVNAWIDLDQDCIWNVGNEWFMNAALSPAPPADTNDVDLTFQTDYVYLPQPPGFDPVWLRARLDYGEDVGLAIPFGVDGTLLNVEGAAQHGEVEDYPFWCTTVYEQDWIELTGSFFSEGICQVYPGPPGIVEQTYWAAVDSADCLISNLAPPATSYDALEDATLTEFLDFVTPGERRHSGKCKQNLEYLTMLRTYWIPDFPTTEVPSDYWIPSTHAMLCYTGPTNYPVAVTVAIGVPNASIGGWIDGTQDPDGHMVWDDALSINVCYRTAPQVLPLEKLSPCDSLYASLPKVTVGSAVITPDKPMKFGLEVEVDIQRGEVLIVEVESSWSTNSSVNHQILEFPYPIGNDPTGVDDDTPVDAPQLALETFPNPFNPTNTIRYTLPEPATVTLRVFDVNGRLIRTLVNGEAKTEGMHEMVWDSRDDRGNVVSSGVYFYQLIAGDRVLTGRAVLLK